MKFMTYLINKTGLVTVGLFLQQSEFIEIVLLVTSSVVAIKQFTYIPNDDHLIAINIFAALNKHHILTEILNA